MLTWYKPRRPQPRNSWWLVAAALLLVIVSVKVLGL